MKVNIFVFMLLFFNFVALEASDQWTTASNGNDIYQTTPDGNIGLGITPTGMKLHVAVPNEDHAFVVGQNARIGLQSSSLTSSLNIGGINPSIELQGGDGKIFARDGRLTLEGSSLYLEGQEIRVNGFDGGSTVLSINSGLPQKSPLTLGAVAGQTAPLLKLKDENGQLTSLYQDNRWIVQDDNGDGITNVLKLGHDISSGLGPNIGTGIEFLADNTSNVLSPLGSIQFKSIENSNHITAHMLINLHNNSSQPTEVLRIDNNGYVGIGTSSPQAKLAVNGDIYAKEVKVTLSGWSDHVFEESYSPLPIEEVAQYVQENKHLPGIPSEKEVLKKGIELGEMQAKLLEKIEENMLYIIELNQSVKDLRQENTELKLKVRELQQTR